MAFYRLYKDYHPNVVQQYWMKLADSNKPAEQLFYILAKRTKSYSEPKKLIGDIQESYEGLRTIDFNLDTTEKRQQFYHENLLTISIYLASEGVTCSGESVSEAEELIPACIDLIIAYVYWHSKNFTTPLVSMEYDYRRKLKKAEEKLQKQTQELLDGKQ